MKFDNLEQIVAVLDIELKKNFKGNVERKIMSLYKYQQEREDGERIVTVDYNEVLRIIREVTK